MTIKRKQQGSGITKETVVSYSGKDIAAGIQAFHKSYKEALEEGGDEFGALTLWNVKAARKVLEGKEDATHELQSVEWYASEILFLHKRINNLIAEGLSAEAAADAFRLGCIVSEATLKLNWEPHALRGEAQAASSAEGGRKRSKNYEGQRRAIIQRMSNLMQNGHSKANAAEITFKDKGIGTSKGANIKVYDRHHKKYGH